jgi:hypothetical protein
MNKAIDWVPIAMSISARRAVKPLRAIVTHYQFGPIWD